MESIASKVNISINHLSSFERGRSILDLNKMKELYQCLGIKYEYDKRIVTEYINLFYQFYTKLVYGDDYHQCYELLCNQKNKVLTSVGYVQYLLAEFVFHVVERDAFYNYKDTIRQIEIVFETLDYKQKQIYYDTLGVYLKNQQKYDEALEKFEKALEYGYELTIVMVLYHKGIVLIEYNHLNDAMNCILNAKKIFDNLLIIKRSIKCYAFLACIYQKSGIYDRAIFMQKTCINQMITLNLLDDLIALYNNLAWTYILAGEYKKAIDIANITLEQQPMNVSSYFYLSYIYEKYKEHEKAKEYIRNAKFYMKSLDVTPCLQIVIDAFYTYLTTNKTIEMKLKKLNEALTVVQKKHNPDLQIFLLEFIINFLCEEGYKDQSVYYFFLLRKCYKNHF